MAVYRIEFQIQRADTDAGEFTEVGFGSSGSWGSVDQCAHIINSAVQNGSWETEPGHPDPDTIMAESGGAR